MILCGGGDDNRPESLTCTIFNALLESTRGLGARKPSDDGDVVGIGRQSVERRVNARDRVSVRFANQLERVLPAGLKGISGAQA